MDIKARKHLNKSNAYLKYRDSTKCTVSTKGVLKMTKLEFKAKELMD